MENKVYQKKEGNRIVIYSGDRIIKEFPVDNFEKICPICKGKMSDFNEYCSYACFKKDFPNDKLKYGDVFDSNYKNPTGESQKELFF